MDVCILLPVLDAYKGGNHLPLLAACSDVRFTVVCNRTKPKDLPLPPNVHVLALGGRIGPYAYGIADTLFARSVLKRFPPRHAYWKQFDVIHLNQTLGTPFLRLRKSGVPLLYAVHHPVTADREVAVAETTGFEALRWRLRYALPVRAQRKLCRGMPRVMAVSETMRKRISADYGCDPSKISVVPNGVEGSVFLPVPDADCRFDAAALGSFIHPRKGFRYLIEVYRRLAATGPEGAPFGGKRIADVGRRSDEQRKALQAIPGVTVFGTVEGAELIDIVRHSRTLVSTSLFEGFGLSLIEALACGHPAFAFAVGAVPEVLGDIDPALVSPPRDTAGLVRKVETFLSLDPGERERRGAHYREEVLRRYSIEGSAQALLALYRDMMAGSRKGC